MNLKEYISRISPVSAGMEKEVQRRLDNLTKPRGSLGRLEEVAKKYCLIKNTAEPVLEKKVIFTLAADHGVAEEGVSVFPQEVTGEMVHNFINGGAGINVLAAHAGARVVVADMGVKADLNIDSACFRDRKIARGTRNIARGPAMTAAEAEKAVLSGIELVEDELPGGIDIMGTGDMGIANTTSSSAITAAVISLDAEAVCGRGTGIDDKSLARKVDIVRKAVSVNRPDASDGVDVLAKLGGYEIGGLAGVMLAGAANSIPVVIDGFISGAAALVACRIEPKVADYLIAGHCSVETGHRKILDFLGLRPLLDLDLRLGEGTGAALGIMIVEAGVRIMRKMATFEDAGVSGEND
ncbi:MAG: nicotinate-nucleotide--dimethylbenzimidazole phosphoribosyltransferase [Elusimicrobia bacterium]|nr:nicotinate-nucleotide--dimethylbenzimidazole phosphoribosyltransferase [Elusimicrobiota bacterium]